MRNTLHKFIYLYFNKIYMKKNALKLFALLVISLFMMQACTKSSDPSPADVVKTNLVRTWRLDVTATTIQGLPIALILPTATQAFAPLRFTINENGTYAITGAALPGIAASGTWALDPANSAKMTLNPGNVILDITSITTTSMKLGYSLPSAGTDFAVLPGASVAAAVVAAMVSP
jgi:hypothetical protein